jgi:aerobic carbon-monoxide dehydrogenase medium subunit
MKPAEFSYTRPETLSDALGTLKGLAEGGRVIAGGQSLGPMLNFRLAQPKQLVDISRLDRLRETRMEGEVLAVGACITHAEIEDGALPDVTLGLMPFVARGIAYRAVRNRGTIGGSLAHGDPAADWLTTMIAMDATLRLSTASGRRELKVAKFVKGAMDTTIAEGEIITHVVVPRLSPDARWGHAKYAKKLGDFAQSMAIAVVDPKRKLARVVLGRRSEPPALLPVISECLTARASELAPEARRRAIENDLDNAHVDPNDRTMHRAIIERALESLLR